MYIPKKKANRNEAETRSDHIDPRLEHDGWGKDSDSRIRREFEITKGRILVGGKRSQRLIADYVLIYKGQKVAVVEAKKEGLSYTEGVRQAKDYAERLQCRFAYATNGHEIYQIDMLTGDETLVDRYLSPEEIWALIFDNEPVGTPDFKKVWRERFAEIPFETKGDWQPRYYQENAINKALDAIAAGESKVLLTLATGTGKTCIAFQLSWKLFQSRWSLTAQKNPDAAKRRPRILFLADRNILANQAFNDFGPFGEDAIVRIEPSEIRKKGSVPKNASVFFTIFQTFMSGPKDDEGNSTPYFGEYPANFFDFIIIDECHRGGAKDESNWREILKYFSPAVQLGLTATPKRKDNVDTYKYFGEPVYSYTLKEGINDGFLTPFKVYSIVGTMDEYVYTPGDGVVVHGDPEPGKVYKEADFNRIITIPKREENRVHYWMDLFRPNEKTIVFCATQEHAGLVRDYINQYAKKKGWITNNSYCVRVTANDGAAGENDLKTFADNEKTIPTILTTSRKLSTGVDARNVRNIVLMRPCTNMIEFKQIVGRGTRMYEGKDYFTIYDFVKAHHNFADPEWDGEPIENIGDCKGPQPPKSLRNNVKQFIQSLEETPRIESEKKTVEKIEVRLSDGRTRQIKHISSVMYWFGDKPITAKEFVERLFSDLPRFFENEDQLREIWSNPTTREKLLLSLTEAGYDEEKLEGMKELIDAKNSDVYDVLRYVAYASEAISRHQRVSAAHPYIEAAYNDDNQQQFIDFILEKYIEDGVTELSPSKMRSLIELKYNTIGDAVDLFGSPAAIRETFIGFQGYLYKNN
ncbi:EcoAI/FtnUII family type I restriction enzme subunit R [Neptunicella sp. SCSIO 80796]|uniref:EcoAI/FtnUII family type I restriction enzme subunit R n=1 Tax=Neptunicella plasticusilytica TaxID=3117012 RepID=UPI003A4D3ADD